MMNKDKNGNHLHAISELWDAMLRQSLDMEVMSQVLKLLLLLIKKLMSLLFIHQQFQLLNGGLVI
jgi:hypothetical protein